MLARSSDYRMSLDFYRIFTDIMSWKDWGRVLGAGEEDEASVPTRRCAAAIDHDTLTTS